VLVDSEPEVSAAAIDAAATFDDAWSRAIGAADAADGAVRRRLLMQGLRRTRPVLVRGYEAVVMARLLAEALDAPGGGGGGGLDRAVGRIVSDWPRELDAAMRRFFPGAAPGRAPLEAHFERRRAAALAGPGRAAWLALNAPYATRGDALRAAVRDAAAGPIYFVSSKKAERVAALLQHHFALPDAGVGSPRLFASLLPPEREKARALREIAARPAASAEGVRRHFVDDRLDTLLAVAADAELARGWTLYLAAWGYCAEGEVAEAERLAAERRRAARGARGGGGGGGGGGADLRVLRRPEDLAELLRWGLVSGGVDDGCEPTESEKRAEGWLSSS
jgi:hypothetical protein